MRLNIIQDTREQQPLQFKPEDIAYLSVSTLQTGDYSMIGYEDILCIERKSSLSEFANNITEKRFWNEMERMKSFQYKFMVLEFSAKNVVDFPESLNLPKSITARIRISANFIIKCLTRIQVEFGIPIIFASNRDIATAMVLSIMRKIHEEERRST